MDCKSPTSRPPALFDMLRGKIKFSGALQQAPALLKQTPATVADLSLLLAAVILFFRLECGNISIFIGFHTFVCTPTSRGITLLMNRGGCVLTEGEERERLELLNILLYLIPCTPFNALRI